MFGKAKRGSDSALAFLISVIQAFQPEFCPVS
jgi:hypothetical protein